MKKGGLPRDHPPSPAELRRCPAPLPRAKVLGGGGVFQKKCIYIVNKMCFSGKGLNGNLTTPAQKCFCDHAMVSGQRNMMNRIEF